jgi:hypothetical protein
MATGEELDRYVEAWSQPGAATGMINYYRSSVPTPPKRAAAALRPISAPTLVIWGQRDRYLGEELAEPERDDVPNLDRIERLPDASHWVHHDESERVTKLLIDFRPRPANQKPLTVDQVSIRPGSSVRNNGAAGRCLEEFRSDLPTQERAWPTVKLVVGRSQGANASGFLADQVFFSPSLTAGSGTAEHLRRCPSPFRRPAQTRGS